MGKTYKEQMARFDDERNRGHKHHRHSNNTKFRGMKIDTVWVDEFFDVNNKSLESYDINKVSDEEL